MTVASLCIMNFPHILAMFKDGQIRASDLGAGRRERYERLPHD